MKNILIVNIVFCYISFCSAFGQMIDFVSYQTSHLGPKRVNILSNASNGLFTDGAASLVQCVVIDARWNLEHETVAFPIQRAVATYLGEYELILNLATSSDLGHGTTISLFLSRVTQLCNLQRAGSNSIM